MSETHQPAWDRLVVPFTKGTGLVAEILDPLTWGLDLEDEAVTGDGAPGDPTAQRFLRAYRSFTGEALEVETLPSPCPRGIVDDVVRAAASSALAAPLHDDLGTNDLTEGYASYRLAVKAICQAVDGVPLEHGRYVIDGISRPSWQVDVNDVRSVYTRAFGRGVVVSGPRDLIEKVQIAMRPVRCLLGVEDAATDLLNED